MFAYVVVPSEAPTRCQANNRLSHSVTIEFKVNNYVFFCNLFKKLENFLESKRLN